MWVLPVIMLLVCNLAWKEIYRFLADFRQFVPSISRKRQTIAIIVAVAMFAIGNALLGEVVILLGIVFFVAALVLEWLDKRRTKANTV